MTVAFYGVDLPFPHLLSPSFHKKVTFYNTVMKYRSRESAALSFGLPFCHEMWELSYPSLTDAEVSLVEAVFNTQETDYRLSWTPPMEEDARWFKPPTKWSLKRLRLIAPRGGSCAGNTTGLGFLPSPLPSPDTAYRTQLKFSLEEDRRHGKEVKETIVWDMAERYWDSVWSFD